MLRRHATGTGHRIPPHVLSFPNGWLSKGDVDRNWGTYLETDRCFFIGYRAFFPTNSSEHPNVNVNEPMAETRPELCHPGALRGVYVEVYVRLGQLASTIGAKLPPPMSPNRLKRAVVL
jgi:hypothetical protein